MKQLTKKQKRNLAIVLIIAIIFVLGKLGYIPFLGALPPEKIILKNQAGLQTFTEGDYLRFSYLEQDENPKVHLGWYNLYVDDEVYTKFQNTLTFYYVEKDLPSWFCEGNLETNPEKDAYYTGTTGTVKIPLKSGYHNVRLEFGVWDESNQETKTCVPDINGEVKGNINYEAIPDGIARYNTEPHWTFNQQIYVIPKAVAIEAGQAEAETTDETADETADETTAPAVAEEAPEIPEETDETTTIDVKQQEEEEKPSFNYAWLVVAGLVIVLIVIIGMRFKK